MAKGLATALSYTHDFGADMNRLLALENVQRQRRKDEMAEEIHQEQLDQSAMQEMKFLQENYEDIWQLENPYFKELFEEQHGRAFEKYGEIVSEPHFQQNPDAMKALNKIKRDLITSETYLKSKRLTEEKNKLYEFVDSNPDAFQSADIQKQLSDVQRIMHNGYKQGESEYVFRPSAKYDAIKEVASAVELTAQYMDKKTIKDKHGFVYEIIDLDTDNSKEQIAYGGRVLYEQSPSSWIAQYENLPSREAFKSPQDYVEHVYRMRIENYNRKLGTARSSGGKTIVPPISQYTEQIEQGFNNAKPKDPADKKGFRYSTPNKNAEIFVPKDDNNHLLTEDVYYIDNSGALQSLDLNDFGLPGDWTFKKVYGMVYDPKSDGMLRFVEYDIQYNNRMDSDSVNTLVQKYEANGVPIEKAILKTEKVKEAAPGGSQMAMNPYQKAPTNTIEKNVPTLQLKVMSIEDGSRAIDYDNIYYGTNDLKLLQLQRAKNNSTGNLQQNNTPESKIKKMTQDDFNDIFNIFKSNNPSATEETFIDAYFDRYGIKLEIE